MSQAEYVFRPNGTLLKQATKGKSTGLMLGFCSVDVGGVSRLLLMDGG